MVKSAIDFKANDNMNDPYINEKHVNKKHQEQDLSYAYFENLGNVWKRREIS